MQPLVDVFNLVGIKFFVKRSIIKNNLSCVCKFAAEFIASVFKVADFVEAAHDFGGHVDVYDAAVEEEVGKGFEATYVHAVVARHADSAENTLELLKEIVYTFH